MTAPPPVRRVLVIAFDFPPRRTSGVYRPTAFCRYLARLGWSPTVLTIHPGPGVRDESLLQRLPEGTSISRTRYVDFISLEDAVLRWIRGRGWLRAPERAAAPSDSAAWATLRATGEGRPAETALRRAARLLRSLVYFPDDTSGWIPFAIARALRLTRTDRFDAVFTTHPPRAAHVVGLFLHWFRGLPWVAEFRDPWVIPEDAVPITPDQIPAPRRNRWLQARVLRAADAVVAVTPGHARELVERFGASPDKVRVVRNGFDEENFAGASAGECEWFDPDCLNLAHFGTVYADFSGAFFPALADLLERDPTLSDRLRIHVVGFPDASLKEFAQGRLRGVVCLHGAVPHAEALRAMYASDALLLFYGHEYTARVSIPGKLYEYLRVGRPILAVAEAGGVRDLIAEEKAGWVVGPQDVAEMQAVVLRLIEEKRRGSFSAEPSARDVARFGYDRLTGELVDVLNSVARVG